MVRVEEGGLKFEMVVNCLFQFEGCEEKNDDGEVLVLKDRDKKNGRLCVLRSLRH